MWCPSIPSRGHSVCKGPETYLQCSRDSIRPGSPGREVKSRTGGKVRKLQVTGIVGDMKDLAYTLDEAENGEKILWFFADNKGRSKE